METAMNETMIFAISVCVSNPNTERDASPNQHRMPETATVVMLINGRQIEKTGNSAGGWMHSTCDAVFAAARAAGVQLNGMHMHAVEIRHIVQNPGNPKTADAKPYDEAVVTVKNGPTEYALPIEIPDAVSESPINRKALAIAQSCAQGIRYIINSVKKKEITPHGSPRTALEWGTP